MRNDLTASDRLHSVIGVPDYDIDGLFPNVRYEGSHLYRRLVILRSSLIRPMLGGRKPEYGPEDETAKTARKQATMYAVGPARPSRPTTWQHEEASP